jgi:predicted RNA-binding Zn-ribbon protein involved in translation (DUF1610 family)
MTTTTPTECPQCGAALRSPLGRTTDSAGSPVGPKSPAVEFVVCPDCEGVIDGFRAH